LTISEPQEQEITTPIENISINLEEDSNNENKINTNEETNSPQFDNLTENKVASETQETNLNNETIIQSETETISDKSVEPEISFNNSELNNLENNISINIDSPETNTNSIEENKSIQSTVLETPEIVIEPVVKIDYDTKQKDIIVNTEKTEEQENKNTDNIQTS
jgi:hypothetical protein